MESTAHPSRARAFEAAVAADKPQPINKGPEIVEMITGVRPHPATVHRWGKRGSSGVILRTFLVGQRRFVKPSDVRAFLAATNGVQSAEANTIDK